MSETDTGKSQDQPTKPTTPAPQAAEPPCAPAGAPPRGEIGGPKGLEPTRFGDWERAGRCVDF